MCDSLAHRGPDDEGFYTAPGVGLAMRRLSIIDLQGGHQPVANEDGTVWVVFNGEIYNYQELTAQLKGRGHVFSTRSDTETIVHLYEEYGLQFPRHLRGMFGFALWDTKRRRLVLVRDRIGEKPLFFSDTGGELLFASEMKAILQRGKSRRVSAQAVCDFLAASYVPPPRTFYTDIQKLTPGHMLVHEDGVTTVSSYREPESRRQYTRSFEAASSEVAELLDSTVKLCLKSDVEVGGFLSGGIDSSVIVALMRKHAAQVQTFSVGYGKQVAGYNELQYARQVAEEFGTKHHELIIGAGPTVELLPRILWHYDEPHGEPTSILVYLLSEFTRRHVKVALGGTGSDEIFFGYPRHTGIRLLQYYRCVPRPIRQLVVERIVSKWPESTEGKNFAKRAKRFISGSGLPPEEAYLSWISLLQRDVREDLLSEQLRADAEDPVGERFLRESLTSTNGRELLDRAADLDVHGYLPEFQLAYMDRMSMAHGLEVRSPFCDYRLVDLVTSLPASYRLRRTHSKHLLKKIARDWIPREIAERRKVGFDSPFGHWLKGELRGFITEFLSREHIEQSGLLDWEGVSRVLGQHLSGRRNYSLQLWSIMAVEAWYRMYIEDGTTDGRTYQLKDLRGASALDAVGSSASRSPSADVGSRGMRPRKRQTTPGHRWTRRELWEATPRTIRRVLGFVLNALPKDRLLGKRFRKYWRFVNESQWWPADRARAYQVQKLRQICRIAYDGAARYRRMFDEAGSVPGRLRQSEPLAGLPTTDKGILRDLADEMHAVSPPSLGVDIVTTGGTAGAPLSFHMPASRSAIEYAYLVNSWQRAGYRLGMPIAVLRGRIVKPDRNGFRHEYDPILRYHYYSAFHMADENMARYLDHIATIGPCFLHVYPSTAAALARFIVRGGRVAPPNIRGILAESEIVYPQQREMVQQVFGCRYFSCYGHSEKLVLAAECEHSTDYHVWPTYGYFELLDEDGKPVTTPGQRGEIVGTGFINTVMPFIRYRTGDYATYVGDRCEACGREHVIIRDIRGHRTQEVLIAADGSQIPWVALNMHDDTFSHVRQFQFRQDVPGRAVLRIVPAEGFSDEDAKRIQLNLGRKFDGQLQFSIESGSHISLSPRGKAIYVDQRIPQEAPEAR